MADYRPHHFLPQMESSTESISNLGLLKNRDPRGQNVQASKQISQSKLSAQNSTDTNGDTVGGQEPCKKVVDLIKRSMDSSAYLVD
ncbi:MAG: hypothetical protein OXC80_13780 [Gammaproteobacteria bacterium]|nr:hypothetical protein [Gammaproteobacteria bacterium]